MIVCKDCGNSAPSVDGFCSACGNLLEWSGERVDGTGRLLRPQMITPPVWQPPPGQEPPLQSPGPQPVHQQPVFAGVDLGRQPDEEAIRHSPVQAASQTYYDGLYCTVCGEQNMGGRTFCRNCGSTLTAGPHPGAVGQPPRLRWWQRLFRRSTPTEPVPIGTADADFAAPGARIHAPRRRRIPWAKLLPVLVVLALLGVGVGPARQWITKQIDKVRNTGNSSTSPSPTTGGASTPTPTAGKTGPLEAISKDGVTAKASSALGDSPAGLAVDGEVSQWWESGKTNDGTGQSITVTLPGPTDIDAIAIDSGRNSGFNLASRPLQMTITTDKDDPGIPVALADIKDTQTAEVSLRGVTSVTFTIDSVAPGTQKRGVAIREITFAART